jgi:phage/plasmid-associated DNA primase
MATDQGHQSGGLKPPAEVTEATGSYRHDNDLVGQFIEARCIEQPTAKSTSKALHEGYAVWCDDYGYTAMPIISFTKELKKKGFAPRRGNKGNKSLNRASSTICSADTTALTKSDWGAVCISYR